MSSPSIEWEPQGTVAKTSARTSRPTLCVQYPTLWHVFLGNETKSGSGLYYVYYQTMDVTKYPAKFSSPSPVMSGSDKPSHLTMSKDSQIGLRTVRFGQQGSAPTLVMWATWTVSSLSYTNIFLLDDKKNVWTQYTPPISGTETILDGCLGIVNNQSLTGQGLAYFALVRPAAPGTGNLVKYTYFDGNNHTWSSTSTYLTQHTNTGYNKLCILDWSANTQMVLGYYMSGVSSFLDLYERTSDQDQFTYVGVFTSTSNGYHDSARSGMQCAQNPAPALPDLAYVTFEGIDPGSVGKVWVCIHTGKWYFGASVMGKFTTACPGIAAFKTRVYCTWVDSSNNDGDIHFAMGELHATG